MVRDDILAISLVSAVALYDRRSCSLIGFLYHAMDTGFSFVCCGLFSSSFFFFLFSSFRFFGSFLFSFFFPCFVYPSFLCYFASPVVSSSALFPLTFASHLPTFIIFHSFFFALFACSLLRSFPLFAPLLLQCLRLLRRWLLRLLLFLFLRLLLLTCSFSLLLLWLFLLVRWAPLPAFVRFLLFLMYIFFATFLSSSFGYSSIH